MPVYRTVVVSCYMLSTAGLSKVHILEIEGSYGGGASAQMSHDRSARRCAP